MPAPRRIASLLPSATEIVYALGAEDRLVGVTYECDFPAGARERHAVVVGGAETTGLTPAEIDARVRAMAAAGEDLYTLREGALRGLAPDLVLTQDLCRVCALPSDVVDDALRHLGCSADVVALDPSSLQEVLASVLDVARALGEVAAGEQVVAALQARLSTVATAVAERPRPRVVVVEWVDPPFAAGHWVPDLVSAAGGEEVLGSPGGRSVTTTWDEVVAARPHVVLVAPCGYHLAGAVEQGAAVVEALVERGCGAAVWAVDADGLVVRPGPRLVDGVEAFAALLHPDATGPLPAGAAERLA